MSDSTETIRITKQGKELIIQVGKTITRKETETEYEYEGLQYIWRVGDDD